MSPHHEHNYKCPKRVVNKLKRLIVSFGICNVHNKIIPCVYIIHIICIPYLNVACVSFVACIYVKVVS